jgi:putative FmdB family regulatory protein
MPIYEYRCGECTTRFEKLIRRELDETALVCPKCGSTLLDREFSTFAAHAHASTPAGPAGCADMSCPNRAMCGCQ